jgi:hypothetical protein
MTHHSQPPNAKRQQHSSNNEKVQAAKCISPQPLCQESRYNEIDHFNIRCSSHSDYQLQAINPPQAEEVASSA